MGDVAELERLRRSDTVRVIDALTVHESPDGEWDVLEEIPDGSAAALVLLEHHWAVGLRDAVVRAGGFRVSDGFTSASRRMARRTARRTARRVSRRRG